MKIILIPKRLSYKIVRISILHLALSIFFSGVSFAVSVKGQSVLERKVTIHAKLKPISSVLISLENTAKIKFSYNSRLIDLNHIISISANQEPLTDVLNKILTPYNINYIEVSNRIVLRNHTAETKNATLTIPAIENLESISTEYTVKGRVTDERGEGLPGVSIVLKGTQNGTTTDQNGGFGVTVPDKEAVLVISFVGYMTKELAVNGRSIIDVQLAPDTKALQEVVVVGYGSMNKRDLTGAIVKVNLQQQSEMSNVSLLQSIQGAAPGLNIGAVTTAGSDPTISVRGQNTLSSTSGDNAPLIVVDGIIYRGSIVDLNPSNIESIEILKDPSSAAIYGSQAANGVVLVTSKKGKDSGKPVISYTGQFSIQAPSKNLKPFNGQEEAAFLDDVFWEQSRIAPDYLTADPDWSVTPYLKTLDISEGYNNGTDNDWWGMMTGNGHINSQNISVRGSNNGTSYFVSAGLTDQKGFLKNDLYKRYDTRVNLDTKITNWLDIGLESFITNSDYSGVSPSVNVVFHMQPYAPVYDQNGEYTLQPNGLDLNPFLQQQIQDSDKRLNLFGNFHTDIKLPFLDGFNYRINYSHNYRTIHQDRFNQWGANFTGSATKDSYLYYDNTFDNIFSYNKAINPNHRIDVTVVYGVEKRKYSFTEVAAQGFTNFTLGYNKIEAGNPALNTVNSGAEQETSLYTMGRFLYSLKDRYMLTATVRRDGYSGFGSNNKIGVFPSLALGWIISDEDFFKPNVVNFLKFRGSYGTTARRAVGRYQTLARMTSAPSRIFGDGQAATIGQYINKMANDQLGWETTTGLNIGADFELLSSRITGNIEYYANKTKDILYDIQIPTITGFSTIPVNIGKVQNHGLELSLTGKIVKSDNWNWSTTLNYARNRNEIVSILGSDNNGDGQEDDIISNQLFIGQPQNVVYDYEITGMWQLADKEAGTIPSGFFPGTYKINDVDNDGAISPLDRKILGYRDPAYRISLANTVRYKNFSFYFFLNSVQGGKNYYMADGSPYTVNALYKRDQLSYSNAFAFDYWMPENPNAKYRRLDVASTFDARPYDQRNFVRVQDISLAYAFNSSLLEKLKVRNLKVNISAKNLLTFTKWEGWDPETGVGLTSGLPVLKSYTMGLNLEF